MRAFLRTPRGTEKEYLSLGRKEGRWSLEARTVRATEMEEEEEEEEEASPEEEEEAVITRWCTGWW